MSRKETLRERFERLDLLYAKLPKIACQGLCYHACGPIFMTELEHTRLALAHGGVVPPYDPHKGFCPFLTEDHRCRHYPKRPAICRLYGLSRRLMCDHGCKPERWLSDEEVAAFYVELYALAEGSSDHWIMPELWREYQAECSLNSYGGDEVRMPYLDWIKTRKANTE